MFLAGGEGPGRRVGELDEEMVYESRVGDVFMLGSSSWRIEEITHDQVLVTPAPGQVGRMPFWQGDAPGRPVELGRAIGRLPARAGRPRRREPRPSRGPRGRPRRLGARRTCSPTWPSSAQATGHLPDDRTILVERFRDELGDWRLVVHSPFGAPVNAPWALAIAARLRERHGIAVALDARRRRHRAALPDTDGEPPTAELVVFEPDEIEPLVTAEVGGSALFASRFRECAGRSLLLPRRDPRQRTPLWQQRQRAHQLLQVASEYGDFPVVLEAMRECLQDVFDVPGLRGLMRDLAHAHGARWSRSRPSRPRRSPSRCCSATSACSCTRPTRRWPSDGRRRSSLDPALLAELLGSTELRELLDADAIDDPRGRAAAPRPRTPGRRASTRCTTCCAGSAT